MLCCGFIALLISGVFAVARRLAAAPRPVLMALAATMAAGLPLAAWALSGPAEASARLVLARGFGPICAARPGRIAGRPAQAPRRLAPG